MKAQNIKRKIKVKVLQGTPFLLSEQQLIGVGMFGRVVKAYNRQDTSQQLVAKVISLQQTQLAESIKAQMQILKQLPAHANLVNTKKIQISSENNFYLIMQFCNQGSFEDYIQKNKGISETEIWQLIKQFCRGYQVLFDNNLIHRDIKPDNILMHNGQIKIADFGFARKVQDARISQNLSSKGTPIYMAPQLQFKKCGSSKIDVFSFGIVIYRMAFRGQFPFGTDFQTAQQYFQALMKTEVCIPKNPKRSEDLSELILRMLDKNPETRISWEQIFDYPNIRINQYQQKQKDNARNSRKSQASTQQDELQHLVNSLNVLAAKTSVAKVQVMEERFNFRDNIANQTQQLIQFEQQISKDQLKSLQNAVFKGRVLILVIQHTNKSIESVTKKQMHKHIKNRLINIAKLGYKFCLEALNLIQDQIAKVSIFCGSSQLSNPIKEMISKNRKSNIKILRESYSEQIDIKSLMQVRDQYPSHLYDFLTQYPQYPSQIRNPIKNIAALLIDIYDASMKLVCGQAQSEQNTNLQQILKGGAKKLNDYLLSKQNVSFEQIKNQLTKVGLLFV